MEAAQRYLEAKERYPWRGKLGTGSENLGTSSENWARATACAFNLLRLEQCAEVAKPEWWNDEGLKALSARVVRAAPNDAAANTMQADVLRGVSFGAWEAGPRSAAELKEAATHWERAAALSDAPAVKAKRADSADWCRNKARELIRANVLLELDAQVEEAKAKVEEARLKQTQLSEPKLLALNG